MSHIQRKAVFALTVALLALLWSPALAFAQSGVWTVISSPNQGTRDNQLLGIAPVSSTASPLQAAAALHATGEVWAVGEYFSNTSSSYRTLVEHCQAC